MEKQSLIVDSVLHAAKKLTVFSGITADNNRIRIVFSGAFEVVDGDAVTAEGEWEKHEKFGRQLKASSVVHTQLSGRLVVPFLVNRLAGVGPERANRLHETFGDSLGDVLKDVSRYEDIAGALNTQGIPTAYSYRIASQILSEWETHCAEYKTLEWFENYGVTDPGVARKVARFLGDKTVEILDSNPYILAGLFPWHAIEKVAVPLIRAKYPGGGHTISTERLLGAVDSAMRDAIKKGHTCILKSDLPALLTAKLKLSRAHITRAIDLAIEHGAVIDGRDTWRAPGCALMEEDILFRIHSMVYGTVDDKLKTSVKVPVQSEVARHLSASRSAHGGHLHPEQIDAAAKILSQEFAVLHGGAGTGKTTVVKAIADTWESLGGRVELAALSGKATLRLSQSTHRLGRTICRLLRGLEKREEGIESNDLPLLDNKTLLIIDEAGMVDLGFWHKIFEAMPPGCRLLMVGDTAQLPPIGFGLVFHELAQYKQITSSLEKIHRQTEQSGIPVVANAIRNNTMPVLQNYNGIGDGVFFVECHDMGISNEVKRIVAELGGHNEEHDLMVCTAINSGDAGVEGLNESFSRLNANKKNIEPIKGFLKQWFLPDDPVIYLRNNYKIGLFNGSMGWVTSTDKTLRSVTAVFDDGGQPVEHTFSGAELVYLKLAYGITCHKAQGSQAKRVVIPLLKTSLMDPTWLYTAVTRAELQCVLVGSRKTLQEAISLNCAYQNRIVGFRCNII